MEIAEKRRLSEILRGFFLLAHPVPVLFHALAVTVFALLAVWPRIVWGVLILVVTAHTVMQLSIAVLNDYCDRHLDAAGKRDKPIPLGLVRPREALLLGILLMVVMVLLLLPLHPLALLVSLLYLALGQGYNLGLKATPLSGIVFALAIPLIPVYAFVAVGRIPPFLFWIIPVAALLGIALNLANSLPDLEQDSAHRTHTLAVALGTRRTFMTCAILIVLCILLLGTLTFTNVVPVRLWIMGPTLLISCLGVIVLLLFFGPAKALQTRKIYFYLLVSLCLILGGGWLVAALI